MIRGIFKVLEDRRDRDLEGHAPKERTATGQGAADVGLGPRLCSIFLFRCEAELPSCYLVPGAQEGSACSAGRGLEGCRCRARQLLQPLPPTSPPTPLPKVSSMLLQARGLWTGDAHV